MIGVVILNPSPSFATLGEVREFCYIIIEISAGKPSSLQCLFKSEHLFFLD